MRRVFRGSAIDSKNNIYSVEQDVRAHHGNNCKSIDNFKEAGKRDASMMMMATKMTTLMMLKMKTGKSKNGDQALTFVICTFSCVS